MANAEDDDINALAGEYVLGTLDAGERSAVEARIASDAALRAAVAAWERRLQPLSDSAPPAVQSPATLARVMAAIGGEAQASNVLDLKRSVRRWRVAAGAFGAIAAALIVFVVTDRLAPPPALPNELVAVLGAEGAEPVFVATIDVANQRLTIRRVGESAPDDQSYELWAVEADAAPRSLGVIDAAYQVHEVPLAPAAGIVLAVSLEPAGGSPTGAPTGPVVFTGALKPVE